jgi:predicted nucleic acid-binding protein
VGLTFDTGALIALENGERRMLAVLTAARDGDEPITVPAAVVAEWWRGQRGPVAHMLDGMDVEPLSAELARAAGEALARTGSENAIDAIVMASAASRGDIVYTSDFDDLSRLRDFFPSVRVLRVSAARRKSRGRARRR